MDAALPLISYILVNWRTEEWLPRALRSVLDQNAGLREVLLVNNASPTWDQTLLDEFPEVQLMDLPRNAGFAEGNNAALRACGGDFVVLLNCDACLAEGFTRAALDTFARHPAVGTIAPKVLRDAPELDGSWRIDSAGHVMRRDRTALSRGAGEVDQGQYDTAVHVFGASAAAVVYRRAMLDEIAVAGEVFDASFFAYYEDVDLDWRAQLAGWSAVYQPACLAHHRGHGSGGRASWRVRLRAEKNRYLTCAKNDSPAAQWPDLGPLAFYELWHLFASLLRPIQLVGLLLLLWHLPGALARRFAASRSWKRTPADVARQFVDRGTLPPLARLEPAHGASQAPSPDRTYPLASVVLVNYNGVALTAACLRGLEQQTYENLEIIVVDNGSRANEARELQRQFPQIRTLRLEVNSGFTGGCNWGVALARGEWVVLLNNDAIPDPDCIRRLVYAQRASAAWAVSGRLVDLEEPAHVGLALQALELEEAERQGEAVVWDLPDELADALEDSRQNHGLSWFGYIVRGAYGAQLECFYPSGGLCCLPRSTLDRLGPELFPQHWFAYYEDVDLGFRIRALGGWIAKEPRAAAVHLASSTARTLGSVRLAYLRERNRIQLLRSWLPGYAIWRLMPLFAVMPTAILLRLLFTQPGSAVGFALAHAWCICSAPFLNRQRRAAQAELAPGGTDWHGELCGRMRGGGGLVNALCLAWCRLVHLPCLEDGITAGARRVPTPSGED